MKLPDGRSLRGFDAVVPDPAAVEGRVVFWLRGERAEGFQYWERVSSALGVEVAKVKRVCSVTVTAAPAREQIGARFQRLLRRLSHRLSDQEVVLPHGRLAEWNGPRRVDLVLAWSLEATRPLDDATVRAHWPECREVRHIGEDLYLVFGVAPHPVNEATTTAREEPSSDRPRDVAERALKVARASGDSARAMTAQIDLGLAYLFEGDHARADALLAEARAEARSRGDRAREADALSSLALAALAQNKPDRAEEYLAPVLVLAQSTGDRFTEKLALERQGQARRALRDHLRALACFERAADLAQAAGDMPHRASMLWLAGVEQAELGRRDLAIERTHEAIALMRRLGAPQAGWYAQHLAHYRAESAIGMESGLANTPGAHSLSASPGRAIDVEVVAAQGTPSSSGTPAAGSDVLHMAVTATKAMARFVGSGFKTAPRNVHRARRAACSSCEHHTGFRCRICGCVTAAKSRLLHEDCPLGKWPTS